MCSRQCDAPAKAAWGESSAPCRKNSRAMAKAEARTTALNYLAGNPSDGALHALRINGLDTLSGISDLDALLGSSAAPNFVVLPKTETAGHLQILDRLLTAAGKGHRAHRPDRERTWPCRSRGDRARDAAAAGPDAGRRRYGGRSRGGHRVGAACPLTWPVDRCVRPGRPNADRLALLRSA